MKIKLVSYNIHRAIGLDRRFRLNRIVEILNDINADIVLLQEVDDGVPRSRELNLAQQLSESCGYKHYALGLNVSLRKGHYGNATLSKYPIVEQRNIDLTIGHKKNRGCQYTALQISPTQQIDVFNLHLGLSAKERQKQAGLIFQSKEYLQLTESQPCIIGGDFNDWRSLLRALFVEGKDFICATDQSKLFREVAIKTFPSFAPRGALDRVYYKGSIASISASKYKKKMAKIASDHLPIVVEFNVSTL